MCSPDNGRNLGRNLILCEWGINFFDIIGYFLFGQVQRGNTFLINFLHDMAHIMFVEERNCSFKSHKFAHTGHIDPIAIRISDLRSRRYYNDFFGIEPIQNSQDTLFECGTAHDGVIHSDNGVFVVPNYAVRSIINMLYHILPIRILGDKSTQFGIFDIEFLETWSDAQHFIQFFIRNFIRTVEQGFLLKISHIGTHSFFHTKERNFGSIGNIRKYGILDIVVNGFQNLWTKQFTKLFTFLINFGITSSGEVNPLEGTGTEFNGLPEFFLGYSAIFLGNQGMTRLDFLNGLILDIESGLNSGSFGSHDQHFFVLIIIGWTNSCRITHYESIPMTKNTGNSISSIPGFGRSRQDLGHIQIFSYQRADFNIAVTFFFELIKKSLVLGIQKMSNFFQDSDGIGLLLWMLAQFV